MSWREVRVAAYRGKMHGRKSVQGLAVARREFDELTGGELTRFDYIRMKSLEAISQHSETLALCVELEQK